jgi:hypothetical protein
MTTTRGKILGAFTAVGLTMTAGCSGLEKGATCHPDGDGHLVVVNDSTGKMGILDTRYGYGLDAAETACLNLNPNNGYPEYRYSPEPISVPREVIDEARERLGYDPADYDTEPGI